MFKKENRLATGVKFNNSATTSLPEFVFKERGNGLLLNRFGIVVSKKIDKRAVGRNKIKRMFRDILVDFNKNIAAGHDILVIVRIGVVNKAKEEIKLLIKNSLGKIGLIK